MMKEGQKSLQRKMAVGKGGAARADAKDRKGDHSDDGDKKMGAKVSGDDDDTTERRYPAEAK